MEKNICSTGFEIFCHWPPGFTQAAVAASAFFFRASGVLFAIRIGLKAPGKVFVEAEKKLTRWAPYHL